MKKVLFILLASLIIVSCGKDDGEKELLPFEIGENAPFVKPIMDWSKNSEYVKNNLPEEYKFFKEVNKKKTYLFNDIGPVDIFKEITLVATSGELISIIYYFGENDKICFIAEEYPSEEIYLKSIKYFTKEIGEPAFKDRLEIIWKAKNVIIILSSGYSYSYDIEFINPDAVRSTINQTI